jgi:predicted ArsR family transcriptional regulator
MDQRTRALLSLLSADATDAIVERLAEGPAAKTELARELGLPTREVARTLQLLLLAGLAAYRKEQRGSGGRPHEVWELRAADELEGLESRVRAMRHRLIDGDETGGGR